MSYMFICLRVNERRLVVQGTSHGRSIEAERNENPLCCDYVLSVNRLLDEVCSDEYTHIVKLNFCGDYPRKTKKRCKVVLIAVLACNNCLTTVMAFVAKLGKLAIFCSICLTFRP